ncbi:MAG TPA: hypothetical protein VJ999_03580 [Candidatus Sulfotelmatobacter sp.]|nr:hypothetical protein [Candidatus Sulfotelmatobacter sp.]
MKPRLSFLIAVFVATGALALGQDSPGAKAAPDAATPAFATVVTGTGTPNHIAKWLSKDTIGNTGIFENGAGNVGIGTTTPAAKFDLNGAGVVRDTLSLFPPGTHPALSVSGTVFSIGSTGLVTFAAGQIFPGTGSVSAVNSGLGLTGGPITTTGTLSINTSVVPLLSSPNVFTANQSIIGDLAVHGVFGWGVTLDGSVARTMGSGDNPNSGEAGNSLTVTGGGAAVGATDAAGGDLILAGGNGTGAGGSGAVRIQAAAAGSSGTTADTLVDRHVIAPKSAPMGGQLGSAQILLVNPANGDAAGVTVRFTIRANDGGSNYGTAMGSCLMVEAVRSDGSQLMVQYLFGSDSADLSSLVNPYCFLVLSGNEIGIGIGDGLTFVPTTHDIYFEIDNVSGSPLITLAPLVKTPSAYVQAEPGQRVDALHPKLTIQRNR